VPIARNSIQPQKGLSVLEFQVLNRADEVITAAVEQAHWPYSVWCSLCDFRDHGLVYGRRINRYQSHSYRLVHAQACSRDDPHEPSCAEQSCPMASKAHQGGL
jgi:hypothetical protein